MTIIKLLPGVSRHYVMERLARARGNEFESGKFVSPESSAALAVNCFGWFNDRPALVPPFPGLEAGFPATSVEIEYEARFPWSGGTHPWLDAAVITPSHLIGVESKRFEPFRDSKQGWFSDAYDRPLWGDQMVPYERVRDTLKSNSAQYEHLDAAQLVKHAFGLVSAARRLGKKPVLLYLYAEPVTLKDRPILKTSINRHREEIIRFESFVAGAEVAFASASYRAWIASWSNCERSVTDHGAAILEDFSP